MKRNYKSLLSIALVLLLVAITSLTFAFWDQLTESKSGSIDLGQGKTITVEDNLAATGNLVPTDVAMAAGDVDFIDVKYDVTVSAFDPTYELVVTHTTGHALIVAEVQPFTQFALGDLSETITVRFTLTEPNDATAYNSLQASKPYNYTITFKYQPAA